MEETSTLTSRLRKSQESLKRENAQPAFNKNTPTTIHAPKPIKSMQIQVLETPSQETLPSKWSVDQVGEWLKRVGMGDYATIFQKHKIDGFVLTNMKEEDLRAPPLSMTVLGDLKRLSIFIEELKQQNLVSQQNSSEMNNAAPPKRATSPFYFEAPPLSPYARPESPFIATKRPRVLSSEWDEDLEFDPSFSWSLGDKGSIPKLFFSIGYLFFVCFVTAFTMSIVHDRVPDPHLYPPLPDIFLDNVGPIMWAFEVAEIIIVFLGTVFFVVLLFHKHRFVVLKRFCAIGGTVFLLRCLTMFVTSLSAPGTHLKCDVRVGASLEEKLKWTFILMSNLALSINGVRSCGDYMFSGHTSIVTLMNYFISEYTPHNWKGFHTFNFVLNIIAMFCILAAHEHYSIDVFIAFYISSRLFLHYHALANTIALKGMDRERIKSFFPMFSYLEEHTDGMVPNEYEMPWAPIVRIIKYVVGSTIRKAVSIRNRIGFLQKKQIVPAANAAEEKKRRRKKNE